MAWLNLIAILLLQKPALKALADYEQQKKAGKDPVFNARALGIQDAHFWEEHRVQKSEQVRATPE
jgi:AGCS family alanine or glycine:cation symporter